MVGTLFFSLSTLVSKDVSSVFFFGLFILMSRLHSKIHLCHKRQRRALSECLIPTQRRDIKAFQLMPRSARSRALHAENFSQPRAEQTKQHKAKLGTTQVGCFYSFFLLTTVSEA